MSAFIDNLKQTKHISFSSMRYVAMEYLRTISKVQQDTIYEELQRGKGVLDDDEHLDMYLKSFGKMHEAKLHEAFECLPSTMDFENTLFEIYDWGCGQGTASICLLDYFENNHIQAKIERITLIDPSKAALDRAQSVIAIHHQKPIEIRQVQKCFDSLVENDIVGRVKHKLHLFSNILDVEFFDLSEFIHLFQKSIAGDNYFICVGPYYTNNKRADEFIAAVCPDTIFAIQNYEKGKWINDWSMSLREFSKNIDKVEEVNTIRKRIAEFKKRQQFFAGYIIDAVSEELSQYDTENTEKLLKSIAAFDVISNKPFDLPQDLDSKWAVVNNIVTRGIPTLAPVFLEEIFSKIYGISSVPDADSPSLRYKSNGTLSGGILFEALHVIDPRFSTEYYNGDMLESSFEKAFIENKFKHENSEYLIQLLEPQRCLSSLVRIPDKQFVYDRRVDFALEMPYTKSDETSTGESPVGFIIEVDGSLYHSNIFDRIKDERRDRMTSQNHWDTYRLTNLLDNSFIDNWEHEAAFVDYLSIIKQNYSKKIEGDWRSYLEMALAPFAIARIQKMLIEAILCGHLTMETDSWRFAVIERDIPCAAIAIKDLQDKFEHLAELDGTDIKLPFIRLDIISTDEFKNSKLHLGNRVYTEQPEGKYDLCIDISMLLRAQIDSLPMRIDADTYYIARSSHYKREERRIYSARSINYVPLVNKNGRGEYTDLEGPKKVLTYFLNEVFRKRSFRKGQLPIISRSLSNHTTIGLLPTGGGKSLTYQISSVLQPGVTLVVDPLISLMVDQCRGLTDIRIDASACVNSTLKRKDRESNLNQMQNGNLLFILLSPERFMMTNFRESLYKMSTKNNVYFSYGVIDEVHCVSEWGHDFRPSYLHLGRNMIRYMCTKSGKPISIIGLTATASFDVLADVERELTLGGDLSFDSEAIIRPENDTRPELTYKAVPVNADFSTIRDMHQPTLLIGDEWTIKGCVAEAKKKAIRELFDEIPHDLERLNEHGTCKITNYIPDEFYEPDDNQLFPYAGIIFCPHKRGTFGVIDTDTTQGIASYILCCKGDLHVGTFVGGDKPSGDMKSFNDNEQNVMVATKAFGMGIDKPNVRYTINVNHPSSIESFVQEAGRGGRDRKNAISYLLYESTEFINLSVDKINDIRYIMGKENDPIWLWNYRNRYILAEDLATICFENGCNSSQTNQIITICKGHGFYENVDKNIELWFHNNSFRGLYKEKVILNEMTDRILNTKPSRFLEVQEKLRDNLGSTDYRIRLNVAKNSLQVVSEDDGSKQYGYLFLENLHVTYKFIGFDMALCQSVMSELVSILHDYPQHDAAWLNHPIDDLEVDDFGIYAAIKSMGQDDYIYVTVSWENQIQQNYDVFVQNIYEAIQQIAIAQQWNIPNEQKHGSLKLDKINDFDSLLSKIAKISEDPRWLIYHANTDIYRPLQNAFCKKRDKDDTDKAIYRMCCVGLVEDVTIDYGTQTYQLMIKKRDDQEYLGYMLDFFKKYYSSEQAEEKVAEIQNQKGRNILDKCLSYLASFVYNNLEKKRFRAIEDMRLACEDGIEKGEDWLKEFIHLYFNSKYARDDYKIDGNPYSLKMDTDKKTESFELVRKYIKAMRTDSSGSEVDNVKHLYGATLLVLRAHPEHAVLHLLRTYCIAFLGTGTNATLQKDALSSYVDGFIQLDKSKNINVMGLIGEYNAFLSISNDDYVKNKILKEGKDLVMLYKHGNWFDDFTDKY
ncbi:MULTISPECIES: DEAD/DEAH box helicase [Parabacteroides]|uniref:DEAD/DEAH box helicase n=1 Tax=Parabacteroides leei TaxID=2939491 RepID=UPI00189A0EFB|nr:DEAD/DEAH box helicase [Parabacteroides goldsteinii]